MKIILDKREYIDEVITKTMQDGFDCSVYVDTCIDGDLISRSKFKNIHEIIIDGKSENSMILLKTLKFGETPQTIQIPSFHAGFAEIRIIQETISSKIIINFSIPEDNYQNEISHE